MRKAAMGTLLVVWVGVIAAGTSAVWAYQAAPGRAATAPAHWPTASTLVRTPGRATLVQINHPKCACTRASLDELNTILNKLATPVSTYILFVRPDGANPGFEQSETWVRAHDLPGATVVLDDGGVEAERFGAWTSGQTVLYDADGGLVFSGGITAFRGHIGDNVGRERVLGLIESGATGAASTAVFGCELRDREPTQ